MMQNAITECKIDHIKTSDQGLLRIVAAHAFTMALVIMLVAIGYLFPTYRSGVVVSFAVTLGYVVISILEKVLPNAGPRKSTEKWWLHLQIALANFSISIPIGAFFGSYCAGNVSRFIGFKQGIFDLTFGGRYGLVGLASSILLGIITADFFYYWFHRSLHKSQFLWQHHKMHHLDPAFDSLTGQRLNWIEYILSGFMYALPSAILFKSTPISFIGVGVNGVVISSVIVMLVNINHSNLRLQFGRLSFLWTSSQLHRIHHSLLPQHYDKNFAAFFPLWDVMFGTYYHPKCGEFPPTGVTGERDITSFCEVQIFTIREWAKFIVGCMSHRAR